MLFFKLCPVSYNTPYEKIGDEVRSLADEVPFDIPDSWEWVRIRSLGEIVRGSGIKRNETVQQGLPCVRYGELYTTYQTSFTSAVSFIAPDLYEKCKHFSYGDVLMTLTGENKPDIAKAVAYLGTEPIAASGDLAFWTQHGMNPLFLSYIMASPYIIARKVRPAARLYLWENCSDYHGYGREPRSLRPFLPRPCARRLPEERG